MSHLVADQLLRWLENGRTLLGEIRILQNGSAFLLRHHLDEEEDILERFEKPEAALELGKFGADGKYRPLRTAPGLKRSWQLELRTVSELVQALDFFYPAMLGTALAFEQQRGQPVSLRETLNRQTGMYRVAGKITDAQADTLIGNVCAATHCLKTNTWPIDADRPITCLPPEKLDLSRDTLQRGQPFIPLPCEECCNILVAAARETVKTSQPPP